MATGSSENAKKFTKTEKSWILYDWANSVYATNIMAVLFPIYFGNVCAAAGADNLVLWSYTRAIRSGCSWPAWCWAWPLPCSPP